MEEKLAQIRQWLGTGSINIFGLPMSGKDTQGIRLAEALGAKFLSSGMIIRAMEEQTSQQYTNKGDLAPTDLFYEWVLPYFEKRELFNSSLILSSIGRWKGEENQVISVASGAGHPIMVVINLAISAQDAMERFRVAKELKDRGERADDQDEAVFKNRLNEFNAKTVPVLTHYRELELLIDVNGNQTREEVFNEIVEKLYQKTL